MNQQKIELQLWEYIDGTCSKTSKVAIEQMIHNDEQWRNLYEALVRLHQAIPNQAELEQPSLLFTKNIMESIAKTHPSRPVEKYINPFIVKIIFGFFVVSLTAMIIYAAIMGNRKTSHEVIFFAGSAATRALVWIDVLVALMMLDRLFRRKKKSIYHPKQA